MQPLDNEKIETLTLDVLHFVQNTLRVHYRFLQSSIDALALVYDPNVPIATDGMNFYFDTMYVLRTYKNQKERLMREYLHSILHCIFHHPFIGDVNQDLWDLSCDIAVENVIDSLQDPLFQDGRQKVQEPIIEDIRKHVLVLTAERIYHYLREEHLSKEAVISMQEHFYHDDHSIWYQLSENKEESKSEEEQKNDTSSSKDKNKAAASSGSDHKDAEGSGASMHGEEQKDEEKGSLIKTVVKYNEDAKENWNDISASLETDLETIAKHYGDKIGELLHNIKEVNRVHVDYDSFLKQFAVFKEDMKLNEDEFDYIFYMYGMKLYKNIPIVEPLEYKEDKKIHEFVIAIDTSASVQGDVVKTFVSHTFQILQGKNTFFKKFQLYVIQCDRIIQDITLITNKQELDNYMDTLVLHGFGGTDFRPVFDFIEGQQREGKLQNLKGMLYFTDGDGIYPYKEPPYKTAFLFYDKTTHVQVPLWAIQIDLDEKSFQGEKL